MNIRDALKRLREDKRAYFQYKFPQTRFKQDHIVDSEEEFLKGWGKKSINPYKAWERTEEYKALVSLYLQSKTANDLNDVYEIVSKNAREGDEKSVKLFLQMTKEIESHAKKAEKFFNPSSPVDEYDDDLIT